MLEHMPDAVPMFERFTGRARHVVVLSQDEARRLHHNHIGTEHLLLGLLGEPDGLGGRVLANFGMSLEAGRREVTEIVSAGTTAPSGGRAKASPPRSCRSTPTSSRFATRFSTWRPPPVPRPAGAGAGCAAAPPPVPASPAPQPSTRCSTPRRPWTPPSTRPPGWPAPSRSAPITCCSPPWPTPTPPPPGPWRPSAWTSARPGRRFAARTSPAPATSRPRRPAAARWSSR